MERKMNRLPARTRHAMIASVIGVSVSLHLFALADTPKKWTSLASFWLQILGFLAT
jgi:phosphate/sulfate permease